MQWVRVSATYEESADKRFSVQKAERSRSWQPDYEWFAIDAVYGRRKTGTQGECKAWCYRRAAGTVVDRGR